MQSAFYTRLTLIERVKLKHDNKSWSEFVHYYQDYLYMICRRMSLNHHDSEEIIQKVLVKLWEKLPDIEIDKVERFRAWLCVVTGNAVKDFLRSRTRKGGEHQSTESIPEASVQSEIESIADEEWKSYLVALALEVVTPRFSKVVISVFHDLHAGVPRDEVAKKYSIPIGTVSVYKHRVLSALCTEIRKLERNLG